LAIANYWSIWLITPQLAYHRCRILELRTILLQAFLDFDTLEIISQRHLVPIGLMLILHAASAFEELTRLGPKILKLIFALISFYRPFQEAITFLVIAFYTFRFMQ
jgi:hypothetical protein